MTVQVQISPALLPNRNFVLWALGSALSAFAASLSSIASSFLILHQTGSAGAMGVNLALNLLPGLFSPFLGALVDRLPLRLPAVAGNVLRAGAELGLGFAALHGPVSVTLIYALSLFVGLINAFYQPATAGMTARLVPAPHLPRAVALVQGTGQAAGLLGFLGGGFVIAGLGREWALVLAGGLFLMVAGQTLLISFPARQQPPSGETFWISFVSGLRYVRGRPVLIALPFLVLGLNASLAPLEALLPRQMLRLGAGERGFGLYSALLLGGMVAGSLLLGTLGARLSAAFGSVLGLLGTSGLLLALAWTTTPLQMDLLALPSGLASALLNVGISVLFQQQVRAEFCGRVGSLLSTAGTAGIPLTLLILAPVLDHLRFSVLLVISGVTGLTGTLLWVLVLQRTGLLRTGAAVREGPPG